MSATWHIDRRTFLRGLGTTVALPMLDAMLPSAAIAAIDKAKSPRRMAFFFIPNGAHMPDWTPTKEGTDFELPPTLKVLESFKDQLLVLSGLTHDKGRANGDGPGDHARSAASFLTGCQARKTAGADIKLGVSVDQVAAQKIGKATRFPSLELGIEPGPSSGGCDSGYSCAYSNNISWRSETTPVPKEVDPRLVFERLFGNTKANEVGTSQSKREEQKKSILDFVQEDARDLRNRLGIRDQQKLDEYLHAVREVESRIAQVELLGKNGTPNMRRPSGISKVYSEHARLMMDLLALALQTDQTRIATFMMANDGSNRAYAEIGIRDGHHDLSHHGRNKEKQDKISRINQLHMAQFAHLLRRLKSVKEGSGTLLDSCMLLYGAGIGDGNRHNHDDLPIIIAGRGGGTLETGRHVKYERNTPMNNLFLSMLERMEVRTDKLGDSTGHLLPKIS
jgi:hypothetical protein